MQTPFSFFIFRGLNKSGYSIAISKSLTC